MKTLIALMAVASTAYVGYSYSATDGESCLVCPMTGEAIFASAEAEPESGTCCAGAAKAMLAATEDEASGCQSACCAGKEAAMLTAAEGEGSACCKDGGTCSKDDAAMLTSTTGDECHGDCEKACCKDKETAAEQDVIADVAESEEEVAEASGTE